MLKEAADSEGEVILFIDEIHSVMGAGDADGAMDASALLKPQLARGEIAVVGATTLNEYRAIEKDAALARRFQPVMVAEPTPAESLTILRGIKEKYQALRHTSEASRPARDLPEPASPPPSLRRRTTGYTSPTRRSSPQWRTRSGARRPRPSPPLSPPPPPHALSAPAPPPLTSPVPLPPPRSLLRRLPSRRPCTTRAPSATPPRPPARRAATSSSGSCQTRPSTSSTRLRAF